MASSLKNSKPDKILKQRAQDMRIKVIDKALVIPSKEEYEEGWNNLKKADFKVDYILTHSGPYEVLANTRYGNYADDEEEFRRYLQKVADNVEFKAWYFGHFHEDIEMADTFFCLYDEVIEL